VALDIFIPYWGDVNYMKLAVDSVLAQTSPDWRLTVVDDAYPGDAVRRYVEAADDPRITYIRKEKNEGITENFRTCVSLASQDVLVVMGCDDLLLPNFVDVVLRAHAEFPDAWIIQPGVQIIDEDGKPSVPLVDIVKQRLVKPRGTGSRLVGGERPKGEAEELVDVERAGHVLLVVGSILRLVLLAPQHALVDQELAPLIVAVASEQGVVEIEKG